MKKSRLIVGCLYTLLGIACLIIALLTETRLEGILWGLTGAGIVPGIGMLIQYFYWNSPKHRDQYAEQQENKNIEIHDELKTKIRDKAARYTFTLGIFVTCAAMMIFTILDALGIIENGRIITLYLVGFLLFQEFAAIVIFNHLLKKY